MEGKFSKELKLCLLLLLTEKKLCRCAAPVEMISFTFDELNRRDYNMRCLDYYGAQPEKDAALIVAMLAGKLTFFFSNDDIRYPELKEQNFKQFSCNLT